MYPLSAGAQLALWRTFEVEHFDAFCVSIFGAELSEGETAASTFSLSRLSVLHAVDLQDGRGGPRRWPILCAWILEVRPDGWRGCTTEETQ